MEEKVRKAGEGMYRYIAVYPSGKEEYMLSEEHMLYTWEAAESINVDKRRFERALDEICEGKPEYYYVTAKGKRLRCYRIAEIIEAAIKLRDKG